VSCTKRDCEHDLGLGRDDACDLAPGLEDGFVLTTRRRRPGSSVVEDCDRRAGRSVAAIRRSCLIRTQPDAIVERGGNLLGRVTSAFS